MGGAGWDPGYQGCFRGKNEKRIEQKTFKNCAAGGGGGIRVYETHERGAAATMKFAQLEAELLGLLRRQEWKTE
ncbi:MAG TPA: hypothetical protein VFU57_00270 [Candidatus Acidoferrales bacterium]|nr:hypothetical protein [Candidatus Acidoferrales bacterium]